MSVIKHRYKLLQDFERVYRFLQNTYEVPSINSYLLPPFFEYAHTHPSFDWSMTHRYGIFEEKGNIIGVTCYEMELGECFLCTQKVYEYLLPELLEWAEHELFVVKNGVKSLNVWTTDSEIEKRALLIKNGYTMIHREPVKVFPYEKPFLEEKLPEGFTLVSLEIENDFQKIHACLWKGFNHEGEPKIEGVDDRIHMQSGPRFRRDLTTVIKAPSGEYACFAGMWYDEVNHYAYLEPLATIPKYRRMKLGTIALMESMKKTKAMGATTCFGGHREFYTAIGFEIMCYRELWEKKLEKSS